MPLEPVESDESFSKLRDWIDNYMRGARGQPSSWLEGYERHQEFWDSIPDIVGGLNRRKYVSFSCYSMALANL
jgi:hypothetical protein